MAIVPNKTTVPTATLALYASLFKISSTANTAAAPQIAEPALINKAKFRSSLNNFMPRYVPNKSVDATTKNINNKSLKTNSHNLLKSYSETIQNNS